MIKLKRWLIERFLPAWCRDELLEENRRLRERLVCKEQEIDRLEAYIQGIHDNQRRQGRIVIHCKEVSGP